MSRHATPSAAEAPERAAVLDVNGSQPFGGYLRELLKAGGELKSVVTRLAINHNVACSFRSMQCWIVIARTIDIQYDQVCK